MKDFLPQCDIRTSTVSWDYIWGFGAREELLTHFYYALMLQKTVQGTLTYFPALFTVMKWLTHFCLTSHSLPRSLYLTLYSEIMFSVKTGSVSLSHPLSLCCQSDMATTCFYTKQQPKHRPTHTNTGTKEILLSIIPQNLYRHVKARHRAKCTYCKPLWTKVKCPKCKCTHKGIIFKWLHHFIEH